MPSTGQRKRIILPFHFTSALLFHYRPPIESEENLRFLEVPQSGGTVMMSAYSTLYPYSFTELSTIKTKEWLCSESFLTWAANQLFEESTDDQRLTMLSLKPAHDKSKPTPQSSDSGS